MNIIYAITGCGEQYERTDAYPFRRENFALPYLAFCAALALGEAIGFRAAPASSFWPLALFVLVMFSLIGYGWAIPHWPYVSVFLLGMFLALFSESCRAKVFDQCDYSSEPYAADFEVKGRVSSTDGCVSFDSSVDGVDMRVIIRNRSSAGDSNTCCRGLVVPSVGEIWHCSGWLERKPREDRRRRILWVSGRGGSAAKVGEPPVSAFAERLRRLRRRLSLNVGYGLSHDPLAADLDRAIILGERANLSQETKQMFADAGTVHIFAISGLHVGIIAQMVVMFLMTAFFFPRRWVALPLAAILGSYVAMIEAPPSAVRAAVMAIVYYAAPMYFRHSDSLAAWSITFLIFHVLNPAMLFNVGSAMSFSVMLGILLFVRWSAVFKSEWITRIGVSIAAWLSGVAIAAHVFERVTIGGLLANLIMIPLASFSVVFGFLGAFVGLSSPGLAAYFNNAAALLIEAMTGISWVASRIPYANLVVEPWPIWMCVVWYAEIIMTFWLIRSVYLHHREII